ncbi:MAG: DNA/RNA nuclease SfsA [Eubacterium sp.]|nr:DNA/RNA nuclease SfsA [Eubacterium sp.]
MKYRNVVSGKFIERPNRFIARVEVGGVIETVHVKNTGRCGELLLRGAEVWLEPSDKAERKTKYDLITVRKSNGELFNIDSQAPNKVAREWLETQGYDHIVPEYRYGASRIDFYMEKSSRRYLLEVKGCTLEVDGIGYFPDAPTERGVKHLRELIHAKRDGYEAAVAFVIQMNGISEVRPNAATHPEFALALEEARVAGVEVLFLRCRVEADELRVINE